MKDKLKRKLRSSQGVTLLLSLLVFLMCVVAGSVALTAGTASSGTMAGRYSSDNTISQRAKLDQRYFSVTSAAELLRETFDGKSVRVTVGSGSVDAAIQRDEDGIPQETDWIKRDNPITKTEEKFVIDQSLYLLSQQFETDTDWQRYGLDTDTLKNTADGCLKTYNLTVTVDSGDITTSGLNATVNISRQKDNDIERPEELNFTVTGGDEERFSLTLKYNASVSKTGDGQSAAFYANWQIGTISYAN